MAKTDLSFLTEYDNEIKYVEGEWYPTRDDPYYNAPVKVETIQPVQTMRQSYNPFEDVFKRKMKKDFEDYLTTSENVRVEQKLRELEKKGVISIYYDKLDKSDVISLRPKEVEEEVKISEKTKAFFWGVLTGIGLMMLLL